MLIFLKKKHLNEIKLFRSHNYTLTIFWIVQLDFPGKFEISIKIWSNYVKIS